MHRSLQNTYRTISHFTQLSNAAFAVVFVILFLTGCSGKKETDDHKHTINGDTVKSVFTDTIISKKGFPLILSDSSWSTRYSSDFFKGYKDSKFTRIDFYGNYFILNQQDTAEFPGLPEIGKRFRLKATERETTIRLELTRINYTTISYQVEFTHPRRKKLQCSGSAHLHPDFFTRMDTDRSTNSGATYHTVEFEDNSTKKCLLKIRLGYEEISGSGLQAKLVKQCNGLYGDITTDNFPTLSEIR